MKAEMNAAFVVAIAITIVIIIIASLTVIFFFGGKKTVSMETSTPTTMVQTENQANRVTQDVGDELGDLDQSLSDLEDAFR